MVYSFLTRFLILFLVVAAFAGFAQTASAAHSWDPFHWARTENPLTLKLIDNVDPVWKPYLQIASSDWNISSVLDTAIVSGVTVTSEAAPKANSSTAPTCSLTLTENKLTWRSRNAQSITITPTTDSPAVGDTLPLNGSATFVAPLPSGEHFYKLAVLGTDGSTAYCGRSVSSAAPVCEFVWGQNNVCNAKYGINGWLGLANIWSNDNEHIMQGIVQLNDSYFNLAAYDKPEFRTMTVCHEVGHVFGLTHQDEHFDNPPLGSCLDYTSYETVPSNQHPNTHDYEVLDTIYAHLDSVTTAIGALVPPVSGKGKPGLREDFSKRKAWGTEIERSKDGGESIFERNLGNGEKVLTRVFWVLQDTAQVGAKVNTIQKSTGVQKVNGVQRAGVRQNEK